MVGTYTEGDEPVPGFRLGKLLGWGRFGEVWRTTGPGGIHVALKIIPLSNRQGMREFRAMKLVKEIRHPNLVPILAFWLKDKHGGFIDEVLADDTLSLQELASEMLIAMGLGERSVYDRFVECQAEGIPGIPREELLDYYQDAAKAIDYLNQEIHDLGGPTRVGIQHCDIKPHNLLIQGGLAQVCDLGVARILEDIRASAATGSAAYIAPEFLKNNKPSRNTDQYSLAISYVEMRTGRLPFQVKSAAAAYLAHLEGRLDLSHLPEPERAVVAKATSLNPDERFDSCLTMVRALRHAESFTIVSLPPSPLHRVKQAMPPARDESIMMHHAEMPKPSGNAGVKPQPKPRIVQAGRRSIGWKHMAKVWIAHAGLQIHEKRRAWRAWGAQSPQRLKILKTTQIALIVIGGLMLSAPAAMFHAAEPRVSTTLQAASPPPVIATHAAFDLGKEKMAKGDYDAAIRALTQAIVEKPESGMAYLERAGALAQVGAYEEALDDLTKAQELRQDATRMLQIRARVLLGQKKWAEALVCCDLGLRKEPRSAALFMIKAAAYQGAGDSDQAMSCYSRVLDIEPRSRLLATSSALVYSPTGAFVASACECLSEDGLRLWSGKPGGKETRLKGRRAVGFSPDEKWLATAGKPGTVLLYDLKTLTKAHELELHSSEITSIVFDKQGRMLTGGADGTINYSDVPSGKPVRQFHGHLSPIINLCWAPGEEGFASISQDGQARAWVKGQDGPGKLLSGIEGGVVPLPIPPPASNWRSAARIARCACLTWKPVRKPA